MIPIHVRDVEKSFGATAALRGTCLSVQQGSIYGLLGRNGAGKTTLLKILIGLVRADSGTAEVLGRSLSDGAAEEKRDVAYVAQGELLPSWATIGDLMRFDAAVRPDWHPESLLRWMTDEGIGHDRTIGSLSGGQSKRVELELALAGRPAVLLLDEPFMGLDPVARAELTETIVMHVAESRATVLLSSHILTDLERLCDQVGILVGGKLAHEASMDNLKAGGGSLEEVGVELIRTLEGREGAA